MPAQPYFRAKELCSYNGYFYNSVPMRTLVVEVELADVVDGGILQAAVDDTLGRMPYLADAFVERDGDFFYAENPLPFEVAEGPLRAAGGPETNWHNLDVTYEGNVVSFSMFHSFCDGMGMNLFIEATLYHYFCRKDGITYPADGIRAKGTPALAGEELEPFARLYEAEVSPEVVARLMDFEKPCFMLPEGSGETLDHLVAVSVRVKEDEFLSFVRSVGSSPAPVLATIVFDAILTVHPECDKELAAFIPIDARKGLCAPNTFKNCASAMRMMSDPKTVVATSFEERAKAARDEIRFCVGDDYIRTATNITRKSFLETQAKAHGFAEKYALLSGNNLLVNNSCLIDYVGGLRLPGYEDQIVSTRYLAGEPTRTQGINLYITATGGYFDMQLVRAFKSDVYERAFCAQLEAHGLAYELREARNFLTPQNGLITALGLL